jgi:hypothetical protein
VVDTVNAGKAGSAGPHLDLLLVILRGIRDPALRLAWVVENLPRSSTTLGIAVGWEALSVLPGDGYGTLPRQNHLKEVTDMADTKHHDPFPPARGPLPKRAPAKPGTGPLPIDVQTRQRPDQTSTTSPSKTGRKTTGDH